MQITGYTHAFLPVFIKAKFCTNGHCNFSNSSLVTYCVWIAHFTQSHRGLHGIH